MIICMPTVPHSGTHFLRNRVLNVDGRFTYVDPRVKPEGDLIYTAHYDTEYIKTWRTLVQQYPTVITLRHPARTCESYRRRNVIGATNISYITQWEGLLHLSDYFNDVMYFHIDDNDIREEQAQRIQEKFDLPIGVDWSHGHDTNSKTGTHEWVIPPDYKVPTEFIHFYEETKQCP